jgi:signal transduction histidine kinase
MSELKKLIARPTTAEPDNPSGAKEATEAYRSRLESENAAIAARSFRIVGLIVFLFQFLYLTADRLAMGRYPDEFLPYYFVNFADALFAIAVTNTRWFPYSWKPLALVQVGTLAATGMIMNIMSGALMPQFYIIITFSFGCATFLPWGVIWQTALNLVCLASYIMVVVRTGVSETSIWYQWISLFAVLLLSEFPAAFIDSYRRRVFRQVEELTNALKASRDKSEFLASMSHEMRTPLNAIIGMTEVLESTELTEEQSQYLEICRANGDTLIGLIDDIVDISRIEAGELRLDRAEFDLNDLMDRICDAVALRAHRKGLELIFDITRGTPVKLIGDPMRLQQVCLNLLVNAIKFTEQGEIVMRVGRDPISDEPGMLRFRLIDTGVGISTEEMKRMFSRFARAESSLSLGLEGSGLGLEISKRLVEAMDGRICVESELGKLCTGDDAGTV